VPVGVFPVGIEPENFLENLNNKDVQYVATQILLIHTELQHLLSSSERG